MLLRPDIQIQTMLRAMTEVVLPAVDPGNKPAQEQAQLVIGMLMMMAQRMPQQFRFDCDELQRLLDFSATLCAKTQGGAETAAALGSLAAVAAQGREVLDRARADPAEVLAAVRELRAVSSAVVTAVFTDGEAVSCRDTVQKTVLSMSAEQILRDRVWTLMQGFERDPASLPDIESLIGTAAG